MATWTLPELLDDALLLPHFGAAHFQLQKPTQRAANPQQLAHLLTLAQEVLTQPDRIAPALVDSPAVAMLAARVEALIRRIHNGVTVVEGERLRLRRLIQDVSGSTTDALASLPPQ